MTSRRPTLLNTTSSPLHCMIFLADSSTAMPDVSPGFFRDWVAVAVVVIGFGSLIYSRITSRRVKVEPSPVPVQVQHAPVYVTREQFEVLEERMERIEQQFERKLESAVGELRSSRKEDIAALNLHLDRVVESVEKHTGEVSRLHQESIKIAFDRINDVADRVSHVEGQLKGTTPPKGARS